MEKRELVYSRGKLNQKSYDFATSNGLMYIGRDQRYYPTTQILRAADCLWSRRMFFGDNRTIRNR